MSIRLSTPQPPSGSISFSFKKTGRAREPAATPPRASVDGAAKDRVDDDAKESMWRNVAKVAECGVFGEVEKVVALLSRAGPLSE